MIISRRSPAKEPFLLTLYKLERVNLDRVNTPFIFWIPELLVLYCPPMFPFIANSK